MHSHVKRPLVQACVALASLWLLPTLAQAATIGEASASITNLRYRLIDLDTNDGITPTLSVEGDIVATSLAGSPDDYFGEGFSNFYPTETTPSISSPLFVQSGTLSIADPVPGTSATLGRTLSASSTISSDTWAQAITRSTERQIYTGTSYDENGVLRQSTTTSDYSEIRGSLSSQAGVLQGTSLLTINGKGLLIIEGTAAVSATVDRSTLKAEYDPLAADGGYGYGNGLSNGYINLALGNPNGEYVSLPGGSQTNTFAGSTFYLSASGSYTGAALDMYYNGPYDPEALSNAVADTQNFALQYANLDDTPTQLSLYVDVLATTGQRFYGSNSTYTTVLGDPVDVTPPTQPPVVVVPGIPEPGTYALMALGLVGLAAAVRRHRPTQRA